MFSAVRITILLSRLFLFKSYLKLRFYDLTGVKRKDWIKINVLRANLRMVLVQCPSACSSFQIVLLQVTDMVNKQFKQSHYHCIFSSFTQMMATMLYDSVR